MALVLALFTAVGGAAAALLALLAARLTADSRTGWLSTVLGCYSLVVIPTTMIDTLDIAPGSVVEVVHILVCCAVVVLLLAALVAPAPPSGRRAAVVALGGAGMVGAAGVLAAVFPAAALAIAASQPVGLVVALAWTGVATAIAELAAEQRAWPVWHVAGGLALLGIADAGRVLAGFSPEVELGLAWSTVHFLAVGLVLWGTLRLAGDALNRLSDEQAAHEAELQQAEICLARSAVRDHELRNGLAGLAGATSLMSSDSVDPRLTSAVAAELCRLEELLQAPGDHRRPPRRSTYAVGPVLEGLVALRLVTGMDIRLDADRELRAVGSSAELAQVVTNLIENAARHAPGSPVQLSAFRDGDEIVIRMRDQGPGVPPGREQAVFEPWVRDERAGGTGLGLHICRRILEDAGGSIAVHSPTPRGPGCTIVVRLPAEPACAPRPFLAAGA
ncbi:sensor histidine kinase [Pseudonocardia cypriaca]|uniref:sensor histidine kinase n=1 Tax=Pseudonocardia cypriaca TaxID=882449 RepID=UPI0011539CB9|nr:ATP-binding protein [Pseudonocardia cypriaca]